jgi:transposase-like protein
MKTEKKIERLVKIAQKIKGHMSGPMFRWPDEVKQKILELVNGGEISVYEPSGRLGISTSTINSWRTRSTRKPSSEGFKKLKVVDGQKSVVQSRCPVKVFVTTSQGSEIQGLTSDEVARLVRRGVL